MLEKSESACDYTCEGVVKCSWFRQSEDRDRELRRLLTDLFCVRRAPITETCVQ